jgi:hypothetical protein
MQYLILLWGDEEGERALGDAERRTIVEAHVDFARRLREAGAHAHGAALAAPATGKTLRRRRDGRPLVTDGPFAETKEQLGGFYVVECASVEVALEWARQVPASPGLVVEVRPVADV